MGPDPLERMVADGVSALLGSVLGVYGQTLRQLLNGAAGSLGKTVLDGKLQEQVARAPPQSTLPPTRIGNGSNPGLGRVLLILAIAFAVLGACVLVGGPLVLRGRAVLAKSPDETSKMRALLHTSQMATNARGVAMFCFIACNFSMFVSSNCYSGASTNVLLARDGIESASPVLHWSLLGAFDAMIHGHAYVLGWAVMICSGIWPYTKILVMAMSLLVTPQHRGLTSTHMRQKALVFVDAVGKASLLDAFFMFTSQTLLHVNWNGEGADAAYSLALQVELDEGFVLFFFATILSLVIGHLLLLAHRLDIRQLDATKPVQELGTASTPLNPQVDVDPAFSLHSQAETKLKVAVPILALLSTVLLPFCYLSNAMHLEVGGLVSHLYDVIGSATSFDVTIWEILLSTLDCHGVGEFVKIGWRNTITALAVLFGFIFPIVFTVCLSVAWFAPLRKRGRFVMLVSLQLLRAWAGLDVCAFALILGWWQIPSFFKVISTDPNQAFSTVCTAMLNVFDTNCFDMVVTPQWGTFAACLQGLVALVASMVVCERANAALSAASAPLTSASRLI